MKIKTTKVGKNRYDAEITCEKSGMPIVRTNEDGMFCDADVCECEIESQKLRMTFENFMADMMEGLPPEYR